VGRARSDAGPLQDALATCPSGGARGCLGWLRAWLRASPGRPRDALGRAQEERLRRYQLIEALARLLSAPDRPRFPALSRAARARLRSRLRCRPPPSSSPAPARARLRPSAPACHPAFCRPQRRPTRAARVRRRAGGGGAGGCSLFSTGAELWRRSQRRPRSRARPPHKGLGWKVWLIAIRYTARGALGLVRRGPARGADAQGARAGAAGGHSGDRRPLRRLHFPRAMRRVGCESKVCCSPRVGRALLSPCWTGLPGPARRQRARARRSPHAGLKRLGRGSHARRGHADLPMRRVKLVRR